MTADELVKEITEISDSLKSSIDRTAELSKALYSRVRREASDPNTSAYINYANAWLRLAGAINQGLTRTALPGVILKRTKEETIREHEEKAKKAEKAAQKEKKATKFTQQYSTSGMGALYELYGEVVDDAE